MSSGTGSAFQTPLTIVEAMRKNQQKRFLLPMIQREFVWDDEQIIRLFDSMMREYPIGSFLFWEAQKESISNYQFYEFVTSYSEMEDTNNPKANVAGEEEITCVLDGQQRLSSLYIGLKGTYARHIAGKRWDKQEAFPERKLHLNLLSVAKDDDDVTGLLYDFRFLTEYESKTKDENTFWFEVGQILSFKEFYELQDYLIDTGISRMDPEKARFANKTLNKLFEIVHKDGIINYYLERSQELDKVLNIFVRINSAGKPLDYSDLLLSIASAQWKNLNARDEIINFVKEINRIGEGFYFDKDFVLKSCLVLSDIRNIAFKVDNFNKTNMQLIENKWEEIKKAVRISVELINKLGYRESTLASKYTIIPISYYIRMKGLPTNFADSRNYSDDRILIKKWLAASLIMRTFSGQPDNVLRPVREVIKDHHSKFPLEEIAEKLKGTNKSLTVTEEVIDEIPLLKYGNSYTFSTLSVLYPTLDFGNNFHIDHIFPQSMFNKGSLRKYGIPEENWDEYTRNCNLLGNLQLLEGTPNEEKSSKEPKKWIYETFHGDERREFLRKNMIPEESTLDFRDFLEFIKSRNDIIKERLKKELKIS